MSGGAEGAGQKSEDVQFRTDVYENEEISFSTLFQKCIHLWRRAAGRVKLEIFNNKNQEIDFHGNQTLDFFYLFLVLFFY